MFNRPEEKSMSKVPGEQFDLCFDSNSSFGDVGREKVDGAGSSDTAQPSAVVLRFRTRDSEPTQKSAELGHGPMLQRLLRRVSKF